jgi:RNA polymerase sigma-70 factor (ECF subfamily)
MENENKADASEPISKLFLTLLDEAARSRFSEDPDLEATLTGALAAARAAWPSLEQHTEDLLRFWAPRLRNATLGDLNLGDLYLACGCSRGDPEAIRLFDSHYIRKLGPALARAGAASDTIVEVEQRMRTLLLVAQGDRPPQIATYQGRGNLHAWLRVAATREVVRIEQRARRDAVQEETLFAEIAQAGDPELAYMKELYRREVVAAFHEALFHLEPRSLNLLRHHFVDRLSIDEIATLYRVHRATAARWLERARDALVDDTRRRIRTHLEIEAAELESILRIVRSRLDLSVRRLLLASR